VKEVVEFNLGLLAIVVGGVDGGNPSDPSRIELIFIPLVIGDVKFEILHDVLDRMEGSNLAQAYIRKDSVDNKECRLTTFSFAERLLVKLKLLCVYGWICPFYGANRFDILVLIIDNNNLIAVGFLNRLHPMGM
jgi:hypothetical protein